MYNQEMARALREGLALERPPIGLAFVDSAPSGVPAADPSAPSACTFWRRAEQGIFYAAASEHYECPIGAMTMGFALPEAVQPRAMELVGTMVELGYFSMDEVPHLPAVAKPHQGIVYGPLSDLPLEPDLVLVQVSPSQAMLLTEAAGSTALGETAGLVSMGRPACAALARAANAEQPTLSLGCIGARTYAEIPEDRALVAIPATHLEHTVERLATLLHANEVLARYHAAKKAGQPML